MKSNSDIGFTLIEIISVLIVMGILATVAISRMNSSLTAQDREVATALKGNLRYAQIKAMSAYGHIAANATVFDTWTVTLASGSYTLSTTNPNVSVLFPGVGSSTVTLPASVSISTTGAVTFDRTGTPSGLTSITVGTAPAITITANTGFIP